MRRFDLLPSAQEDVLRLVEYASEYSERAHDQLTDALFDGFETLSEFPLVGRSRAVLVEGLRSIELNL